MSKSRWIGSGFASLAGIFGVCLALAEETTLQKQETSSKAAQSLAAQNQGTAGNAQQDGGPLADRVADARQRAVLMDEIYQSTLNVMHERYFHGDRAVVPARAMEDIFEEMKHQTRVEAKWISASLEPMSLNHKPKTDFEKQAAAAISAGKAAVETVEGDYFRRATAIPLGAGCIACHQGFFRDGSKKPKFAGLVISVPLKDQIAAQQESTEQTQSKP